MDLFLFYLFYYLAPAEEVGVKEKERGFSPEPEPKKT